jgi:hypothetical protein
VAGLALASLLVGSPADAWVPTPNRPKPGAHVQSGRRYVPARSHADPSSGFDPVVAIVLGRSVRNWTAHHGQQAWRTTARRKRAHADKVTLCFTRDSVRDIRGLPSHWGATHLSI